MSSQAKPGSGFSEGQAAYAADPPAVLDPPRFLEMHELEAIGRKAAAWLEANKALVKTLVVGTVIKINIGTGEHVASSSDDEADAAFASRFGERTVGFVHRVGRPTSVGSGWWALHEAR